MKKQILDEIYLCREENYVDGRHVGDCGDIKILKDWILWLFGEKGLNYFEGFEAKEILEYIYKNAGKRLEKVK